MKKRKAYFKLLLSAAVALLAILLLFGYRFISNAQYNLYQEKLTYLEEISLKSAQNIDEQIQGKINIVTSIADFIAAHHGEDALHWLDMLETEAKQSNFKRMGIITPDGMASTTDGFRFDFSDRDYFIKAMQGKSAVSNRLVDKIDGKGINVYAAPIIRDDEVLGVVFATSTQEQFSTAMEMESFNNEGYSYIVTASGESVTTCTHPKSVGEFQNFFDFLKLNNYAEEPLKALRSDMENGKNGSFVFRRDGIDRQVFYTKLKVTDWYIICVIALDEISLQSNKLITEMTAMSLFVILLVVLGFYSFIRTYQKANARLEHVAYVDEITGCKNWAKFKLDAKKLLADNLDQQYAIISMDINKFKVINDIYGHNSGNNVLLFIAGVLCKNTVADETFCRVSADNFAVLLKYNDEVQTIAWIETIQNSVRTYIDSYKIELCVGVYPIGSCDTREIAVICDRANISRAIAKKQNDVPYHFFKEKNRIDIINEQEIENVMDSAIAGKEFEVYLQPKVCISGGNVVGAEALVRWNRGAKGLVSPGEFIPLFEKNGFIRKLDLYMFDSVCTIMEQWLKNSTGKAVVPISINISRVHLSDKTLPQHLLEIANKHGIPPHLLEVELTESAVFLDGENMVAIMQSIKDAGFMISIDDFGSGYSSLSTLKDLPVDFVKIDKVFLDRAVHDTKGSKILESIINMTRWLGLSVVAEGVETQEQCDFLESVGCDIAQGFFYSRPITVNEFEQRIIPEMEK